MTGRKPAAGYPDATAPAWEPVGDPSAEGLRLRPSLLAAASVFAKIVFLVTFVLAVPFLVALLSGSDIAFLGAILVAETSLLAVAPAIAGIVLPAIRLLATRYNLDAEGVRVRSSIIARSDQFVPWDKVTLLMHRRSIVDRVLGIASVTIVSYGVKGATLHLVGLRDPAPVRDYAARKMRESASVATLFGND